MEATKHLDELHAESTEWVKNLRFFEDELKVMDSRLAEIVSANNNRDVLAQVEHFQNQFILQQEVVDEVKHLSKLDDGYLAKNAQANPVASDHRLFIDHDTLRDKYITFEKIYFELKHDFESFLSKSL